jgi:hypothetical protein
MQVLLAVVMFVPSLSMYGGAAYQCVLLARGRRTWVLTVERQGLHRGHVHRRTCVPDSRIPTANRKSRRRAESC